MSLDELEAVFRVRQQHLREPVVILAMQIEERDIRALRPRLEASGESLSEHVRNLLREDLK